MASLPSSHLAVSAPVMPIAQPRCASLALLRVFDLLLSLPRTFCFSFLPDLILTYLILSYPFLQTAIPQVPSTALQVGTIFSSNMQYHTHVTHSFLWAACRLDLENSSVTSGRKPIFLSHFVYVLFSPGMDVGPWGYPCCHSFIRLFRRYFLSIYLCQALSWAMRIQDG